jgi:hypothetical protein
VFTPAVGISYFFNKFVSIEGLIRYETGKEEHSNKFVSYSPSEERLVENAISRILIIVGLQIYFQ